jgi:hypothetical protein
MPNKYAGVYEEFVKDSAIEHIIKKYKCNPETVTEVAPWGNPHYFSMFVSLCPNLQAYRAIDADWDKGLIRSLWEEYSRLIDEECPLPTKTKFRELLDKKKFEKVTDWYFNTDEFPSDLILLNNALRWSFPSLNLVKSLKDINSRGLIVIKDSRPYYSHTVNLLKTMRDDLDFGTEIYLWGREGFTEGYTFEEAKGYENLTEWNEEMNRWPDSASKKFFIVFQNKDGEIPQRTYLKLTYEAWIAGLDEMSKGWRTDATPLLKKFGERLSDSLKEIGLDAEYTNLQAQLKKMWG